MTATPPLATLIQFGRHFWLVGLGSDVFRSSDGLGVVCIAGSCTMGTDTSMATETIMGTDTTMAADPGVDLKACAGRRFESAGRWDVSGHT